MIYESFMQRLKEIADYHLCGLSAEERERFGKLVIEYMGSIDLPKEERLGVFAAVFYSMMRLHYGEDRNQTSD